MFELNGIQIELNYDADEARGRGTEQAERR